MNKILPLFFGLFIALGLHAQTDLFFSEYVEGSGNSKALEIYNPTKQTIDLSKYYVVRFSNGATDYSGGGFTQLKGTIAPYKTFVLVNGQTTSTESSPAPDAALQAKADQLDGAYPAPTYMNGNDAMGLLKTETGKIEDALPVDLFGQIGQGSKIKSEQGWAPFNDTTITYVISGVEYKHTIADFIIKANDDSKKGSGPYWLAWSKDHTLRRKYTVVDGVKANPTQFNISLEWDTISVAVEKIDTVTKEKYYVRSYEDIWDGLGKHDCIASEGGSGNGVTNIENNNLKVFPTIVNNKTFTIQSSTEKINKVLIYNLIGAEVFAKSYSPSNKIEVDVTELHTGIYLVKSTTTNNVQHTIRVAIK